MTIYEIVKKLIGSIEPYGATHIDEQRKENLNEHIELLDELIGDLFIVAKHKDRAEHSMKEMGMIAYADLVSIKENIETVLLSL